MLTGGLRGRPFPGEECAVTFGRLDILGFLCGEADVDWSFSRVVLAKSQSQSRRNAQQRSRHDGAFLSESESAPGGFLPLRHGISCSTAFPGILSPADGHCEARGQVFTPHTEGTTLGEVSCLNSLF